MLRGIKNYKIFKEGIGVSRQRLDKEQQNQTYKVRIVIRIALKLTKGKEQKLYCYNLHSIVKKKISDKSESILFNQFETELSTYKCKETSSGLEIPVEVEKALEKQKTVESEEVEETLTYQTIKLNGFDNSISEVHNDNGVFYVEYHEDNKIKVATFNDVMNPVLEVIERPIWETNASTNVMYNRIVKIYSNNNDNSTIEIKNGIDTRPTIFASVDNEFNILDEYELGNATYQTLLSSNKYLAISSTSFARICDLEQNKLGACVDQQIEPGVSTFSTDYIIKVFFFKNRYYVQSKYTLISFDNEFKNALLIDLPIEIKDETYHLERVRMTHDDDYVYIFKNRDGAASFDGKTTETVVFKITDF